MSATRLVRKWHRQPEGLQQGSQGPFVFGMSRLFQNGCFFFGLESQMTHEGGIASIVQQLAWGLYLRGNSRLARCTTNIHPMSHPSRRKGYACSSHGSSRMILGGIYITTCPTHVCAQGFECFDEYGCLYGHVQGAHDTAPLRGSVLAYLALMPFKPAFQLLPTQFPYDQNRPV
jgi:hypothetical protein